MKDPFDILVEYTGHTLSADLVDEISGRILREGEAEGVVPLVRLLARFRGFVSARREAAERWREKGQPRVASSSERSAEFFERCADELERTINGEMPADPGCAWPVAEPPPP